MNRLILLILILALTPLCRLSAQPLEEADKLLYEMVEEKGIVGITAGYTVDGEMKWSNSAGYACKDSETLFTDNTLTRTASIAKSMTAVAVMQLVEQGSIDLDKSIQTYLPDFPEKNKGTITTRHLLSHTSGISQYQNTKEVENTIYYPSLEEAMKVFADRPLLFEPGSAFFYTTYGYVVLGRIIEMVSGSSYEAYMQEHIWDKAGMSSTGVEKRYESTSGHSCLYHKKKRKAKSAKPNNLSNRVPGGGFYSTLTDVLKFGNALLEGKLLKEKAFQQMLMNQFEQKEGNPYGLGWFFYGPKPNENVVIGHSGEQTGCAGQLMLIPKSKTVVVVLSNTSGTWKDVVTLSSKLIGISEQ